MMYYVKYILVLTMITLISGLSLVYTKIKTDPAIAAQESRAKKNALSFVLNDCDKFVPKTTAVYPYEYTVGYKNNVLTGYAFICVGHGYSSTIKTMIGISPDGHIKAMRILSQSETPGLGAKITKIESTKTLFDLFSGKNKKVENKNTEPAFQKQYRNHLATELFVTKKISIDNNINLKPIKNSNTEKQIAAITGATISSKAVTDSVKKNVTEFLNNLSNGKI